MRDLKANVWALQKCSRAKEEKKKYRYLKGYGRAKTIVFLSLLLLMLCSNASLTVAAQEEVIPSPTVTEVPKEEREEGTTMIKDGVSDSYIGDVTEGIGTTVNGLVNNEEETVNSIVRGGMYVMEKVIHYIPYVGIGIFLLGAGISVFSIFNKSNRRWGLRMAVVTSIALYAAYIFIIIIYDMNFWGKQPEELIRPENLDHYGEVYFNVWEEVLNVERIAGLADKTLSADVIAILINFYQESAFDVGVAVFGLGLLLSVIMRKNVVIKRWAGIVLCIIVPIILYVGHWYVSRLI